MKKLRNLFLIVGSVFLLSSCGYNSLVEKQETVSQSWAQVQTQYQRRADLIPNLVNTVKGYADFEKSTLTAVISARTGATQMNLDSKDLTPENLAKFQEAQDKVSTSLRSFFNVVFEKYPDLKANQNFMELQAQLEGTENRIAVARQDFNNSVKDYNTKVATFPSNLTAKMFDFDKKAYFEADKGSSAAPEVKF